MKMIKPFISALAIFALAGMWSCNTADRDRTGDTLNPSLTDSRNNAKEIQEFLNEAASDGMKEIKMAEIAMERAKQPQVKELASMIRADHLKAQDELKRIAANTQWQIPTQMLPKHQEDVEELKNNDSEDFDEDYVDMMISAHRNAINKFEDVAEVDYRDRTAGMDDLDRENRPEMRNEDRDRTSDMATNANRTNERDADTMGNNRETADAGQIRAWAQKTLPSLRKHLEHCEHVDDQI